MRVLILSALMACAAAAPQILPLGLIPAFSIAPTISPGDVQAAAINAQVKYIDQVQAISDKARELAMQAVENQDAGVKEANDLVKEKAEEEMWVAEEKKWQDLNAAQIAAAQLEGAAASYDTNSLPVAVAKAAVPVQEVKLEMAKPEIKIAEAEKPVEVKSVEVKSVEMKSAEEKPVEVKSVVEEKLIEVKSADVKPAEEIKELKPELGNLALWPAGGIALAGLGYQQLISPLAYAQIAQPSWNTHPALSSIQLQEYLRGQLLSQIH